MENIKKNYYAFNFKDIAALLICVASLLYVAGWAFAYNYFDKFGVGLLSLDLPKEYYIIYGFWTIQNQWAVLLYILAFYVIISLAPIEFTVNLHENMNRFKALTFILLVLLAVLIFSIDYKLGERTAENIFEKQRAGDYSAYPRVEVHLSEKAAGISDRVNLEKGCYRLLLENKGRLFVFRSFAKMPGADLATLVIPESQVEAWNILPHRNSCK
ncbi:conserved membrane hypothetical protein [Candidatus Magnetomoraceae bacterium gMMP-1]